MALYYLDLPKYWEYLTITLFISKKASWGKYRDVQRILCPYLPSFHFHVTIIKQSCIYQCQRLSVESYYLSTISCSFSINVILVPWSIQVYFSFCLLGKVLEERWWNSMRKGLVNSVLKVYCRRALGCVLNFKKYTFVLNYVDVAMDDMLMTYAMKDWLFYLEMYEKFLK